MSTSSTTTTTTTTVTLKRRQLHQQAYDYYELIKRQPIKVSVANIYKGFADALSALYKTLPDGVDNENSAVAHKWIHDTLAERGDTLSLWIARLAVLRDKHPDAEIIIPIEWATVHGSTLVTYLRHTKRRELEQLTESLPELLSQAIQHNYYGTWRLLLKQVREPIQLVLGGVGSGRMYWAAYRKGAIDPIFHQRVVNIGMTWRYGGKRRYLSARAVAARAATLSNDQQYTAWQCCDNVADVLVRLLIAGSHPRLPQGVWSPLHHSHYYDHVDDAMSQMHQQFVRVFSSYFSQNKELCTDIMIKMSRLSKFFVGKPIVMDHTVAVNTASLMFQQFSSNGSVIYQLKEHLDKYHGIATFTSLWRMAKRLSYQEGQTLLRSISSISWSVVRDQATSGQISSDHGLITTFLRAILPRVDDYPAIKRWVLAGAEPFTTVSQLTAPMTTHFFLEGRKYLAELSMAYQRRDMATLDRLLGNVDTFAVITAKRAL